MFNLGALASISTVLNSMDSAAKETIEDINKTVTIISSTDGTSAIQTAPPLTATQIRAHNKMAASSAPSTTAGEVSGSSEDNLVSLGSRDRDGEDDRDSRDKDFAAVNVELVDGHVIMSDLEQPKPIPKRSGASTSASTSASLSITDCISTPTADTATTEQYQRSLQKKDQEIENLNRECLELEEMCQALKGEVREAWDNYKNAQERAAFREAELQDEMKAVQRAKIAEKQLVLSQLAKMNEDLAASVKQVQAAQSEREAVQSQLDAAEEVNRGWRSKIHQMEQDLLDSRHNSVQGVQTLRDELQLSQLSNEQMRRDHASMIRASQQRHAELEKENLELATSLAEKQKEVNRLLGMSGSHPALAVNAQREGGEAEYVGMQQELLQLSRRLQDETERAEQYEQRARLLECEVRAQQITAEEDRRRSNAQAAQLTAQITSLEEKARQLQDAAKKKMLYTSSSSPWPIAEAEDDLTQGAVVEGSRGILPQPGQELSAEEWMRMQRELNEAKIQTQNLSKMLLKKQASLMELQAEKGTLKSKVADLQNRCTKLEQKLSSMADLELEGDPDLDMDEEISPSPSSADLTFPESSSIPRSSSSTGLQQRRRASAARATPSKPTTAQVISDLERIGVKPSPVVSRAVTMIDSWALLTGRFLRSYSLFRFGFVLYLLILHLWVLFILVLHIHTIESDPIPIPPTNKLLLHQSSQR